MLPLLISDLPVFCRWRGQPDWDSTEFEQLIGIVDRLIVDSTEWPDLPAAYGRLAELFSEVVVSDIAWERTERWRSLLASLWPEVRRECDAIRVQGTRAQGHLLRGGCVARLADTVSRWRSTNVNGSKASTSTGARRRSRRAAAECERCSEPSSTASPATRSTRPPCAPPRRSTASEPAQTRLEEAQSIV